MSKRPGGPPDTEKRDLYRRLMSEGINNVKACKMVGIHPRTGRRWRNGRVVVTKSKVRAYPAIIQAAPTTAISDRYLSEDERIRIADGLAQGQTIRAICSKSQSASINGFSRDCPQL